MSGINLNAIDNALYNNVYNNVPSPDYNHSKNEEHIKNILNIIINNNKKYLYSYHFFS